LAGVGLLGGSLGLALKQRKLADLVVGFVRPPSKHQGNVKPTEQSIPPLWNFMKPFPGELVVRALRSQR